MHWSPALLAAVTQNPVTNCHETFALQEFLNKWCHEDFIQIVRHEYHYHRLSQAPISNNTMIHHYNVTQDVWPTNQSGLGLFLSANEIARSGPGLHLAASLAALGEAALWHPRTLLLLSSSSVNKNCIEIHLSTRIQEYSFRKREVLCKTNTNISYSVWMPRSKSMSVVVKGRVSYIDLKSERISRQIAQVKSLDWGAAKV